jgi:5-methyltetrahydrofolate--homocysteine methyltransferase
LEELQTGRCDRLVQLGQGGADCGCKAIDLLIDHPALSEAEQLPMVLRSVDQALGCPISIDSRDPVAIERALDGYRGVPLLNSIAYEPDLLAQMLPLVVKHKTAVVAMLVDDVRIPQTWAERLAIAHKILEATDDAGVPRDDIVFDCVCMAASTMPNSMQVTLDTLKAVHEELGMSTILGIGNAGFGMPDQTRIDLAYLIAAVPWGLDAALVDPSTPGLIEGALSIDFLSGNDPIGRTYIHHYRTRQAKASSRMR